MCGGRIKEGARIYKEELHIESSEKERKPREGEERKRGRERPRGRRKNKDGDVCIYIYNIIEKEKEKERDRDCPPISRYAEFQKQLDIHVSLSRTLQGNEMIH